LKQQNLKADLIRKSVATKLL